MRGSRPGIRMNLITEMLQSCAGGGMSDIEVCGDVGGYVLSWEYLYCQHQTGLSVT